MALSDSKKLYHSIGQVADMFRVKTSLIRYWEKEFDYFKPHRNKKGTRLFTPEDLNRFRIVFHLVKEKKMTLEGARQYIRENQSALEQRMELLDRLQEIREGLAGLLEAMESR